MSEVGIRALKQNASAVVAAAAAGETVWITDRGRPVAQLSAMPVAPLQGLLQSGRARSARTAITELGAPIVAGDLSGELSSMRGAERY